MAGRMILDNAKFLDEGGAPSEAGVLQYNTGQWQVFNTAAHNILLNSGTTAFTAGSVAFAAAGGALAEDNSRFFWDGTNYRLGLLTAAAPATTFDIAGKFQVNSTGNIVKINNVTTSFPASQGGAGSILVNNGSGTLTWTTTPTTPDALSDVIISSSATTQTALSLQGKAVQTANVFEVQASTGVVGFAVTAAGDLTIHAVPYIWPSADAAFSGYVLSSNAAGTLSWVTNSSTVTWDAIQNPVGAQALSMFAGATAYTTTWTWNATTGAGVNLFNLTDTAANTGTGYLVNIFTAAGSALKPFHVKADAVEAITVLASGRVGIGTAAPGAFALDVGGAANVQGNLTVAGGNFSVTSASDVSVIYTATNGAALNTFTISELVTIAASAFTDSATNLLPANSLIIAVSYKVTVVSSAPTTTFDIGVAGDTARYGSAVPNNVGTGTGSSFSLTIPLNPSMQKAAAKIRVTPDAVPGAADGRIRIVTMYQTITPPTA